MYKPELVMPAGNLEKLKTAFIYGADAAYLGGKEYSLRAHAGNFTLEEMEAGLELARMYNKKIYVAVNLVAHNEDLTNLPSYLEQLQALAVDGLIISDLGVLSLAKKYAPLLPKTISTQANVTNYEAAALYKELGASRIVLAREVSLEDMQTIKTKADLDIEVFVHGAMCVSYSGRCLISHYMTGRSANRGLCAHPCRYKYNLVEEKRTGDYYPIEEDEKGSYILNSRDLCLLEYIPNLFDIGVDALKVEGRMKSPLYIASVASIYRDAIDTYLNNPANYSDHIEGWLEELNKTATRPFTNGFIAGESPLLQDINNEKPALRTDFSGIVLSCTPEGLVEVEQRYNFGVGDKLEFLLPNGQIKPITIDKLWDAEMQEIDRARHPKQKVFFNTPELVPEFTMLRKYGE